MANKFELPQDPKLAAKIIDGEQGQQARLTNMGWIGRAFGGTTEKAGNIAAFAIVFSGIMIAVMIIVQPDPTKVPTTQLYTLFGGIITLALGYVFGHRDKT